MKRAAAVLAVVCALVVPSASAAAAHAPTPAAAAAALGTLLHQLYGGLHGSWACSGPVISGRIDCLAEVHSDRQWHEVALSARLRNEVIVFMTLTNHSAQTWVRRWSPYSRHFIVRFGEAAPGVASVNSPSDFYDWGWIAGQAAGLKPGQIRTVAANDTGSSRAFERFFTFACSRRGGLITCRNALGDAMRYRP